MTEQYDIVVVGGGTAGAFAAATAAREGMRTALLERKSAANAGQIACGDAIKGESTFPDVIDRQRLREESFTNQQITRGIFENPNTGTTLEIPFGETGAVVDRKRYGEILLDEAKRCGAKIQYDTVVQDVQQVNGTITGVEAVRDGTPVTVDADVVIDAAGALSLLQDKADFSEATFDTNVTYSQFCSAYREIVEVPEPVEWADAIYFKPTAELGYLWYFPRTPTEINVGVGFQMNKEPMKLVEVLQHDLESRSEFQGATVTDKRGAALPTRRPYDSAVAPGFMAVGDAAGHVNPTTGGGIPGAAKAGHWAALVAIDAISEGDVSEANLWEYNHRVMSSFGKRFAAMDLFNIWAGAHDVDELVDVITSLPGQQLIDVLGSSGTTSMSAWLKLKTLLRTVGHWSLLIELYRVNEHAKAMRDRYDAYPDSPADFDTWQADRDGILNDVYALSGAMPKY